MNPDHSELRAQNAVLKSALDAALRWVDESTKRDLEADSIEDVENVTPEYRQDFAAMREGMKLL
jgi:hypothetical protein